METHSTQYSNDQDPKDPGGLAIAEPKSPSVRQAKSVVQTG